jgi:hypothetical protein
MRQLQWGISAMSSNYGAPMTKGYSGRFSRQINKEVKKWILQWIES